MQLDQVNVAVACPVARKQHVSVIRREHWMRMPVLLRKRTTVSKNVPPCEFVVLQLIQIQEGPFIRAIPNEKLTVGFFAIE